MKTNKFNGTSYNDWLRNLRIVLDFKNQGYVLDKPLPVTLPEGSSPEERLAFKKWHEDNRKVRSIILASITNEIHKQYDRLEDVASIMLCMKDVYAVPDRHIRYAATKSFFGTKMTKGSSVHSHGVKMLSVVEKLEDLKAGLNNDTQMMPALLAKERSIGRGSVHNSSPTQVLQRSRRLNKDEMILKLGDGKAVAAEAVGSLRLVVSNHIRIDLKDVYFVPIWVTYQLASPTEGFSYFITFTDDHSRYGYVYLMRYKSEAFERFIRYPKEIAGYYFYDPIEQKIIVSRNAVFLKKDFPSDSRRDEVLIEESNEEPHHDITISFEPAVHTDGVPVLRRSTRESRVPERYGFVGLTSQLDNDPKTYREIMSDIDSDKWLEAMKSEMDSMGSNQVWTLMDPPKGVRSVGFKWVYKHKLGADGEVTGLNGITMKYDRWILLAIAAWYHYEI
ncbi:UNVERIFIED_CONTAM: hypothetical protein Sradi_7042000 [Sesamum radiatum]|uniref:Retroviral polymerase SH3-like domain-containing protein n=1 Tax=Sesamum radiatum TaxID=300843 RepID=A0AAW2J8V8_SESRA